MTRLRSQPGGGRRSESWLHFAPSSICLRSNAKPSTGELLLPQRRLHTPRRHQFNSTPKLLQVYRQNLHAFLSPVEATRELHSRCRPVNPLPSRSEQHEPPDQYPFNVETSRTLLLQELENPSFDRKVEGHPWEVTQPPFLAPMDSLVDISSIA